MDNQRLILFVALSVVIMLLYSAWQEQFEPQAPTSTNIVPQSEVPTTSQTPLLQDVPDQAAPDTTNSTVPGITETPTQQSTVVKSSPQLGVLDSGQRISVITDLLAVEINTVGGDVRRVALLEYPQTAKNKEEKVQLFDDRPPYIFIAQSGLLSSNGP